MSADILLAGRLRIAQRAWHCEGCGGDIRARSSYVEAGRRRRFCVACTEWSIGGSIEHLEP